MLAASSMGMPKPLYGSITLTEAGELRLSADGQVWQPKFFGKEATVADALCWAQGCLAKLPKASEPGIEIRMMFNEEALILILPETPIADYVQEHR